MIRIQDVESEEKFGDKIKRWTRGEKVDDTPPPPANTAVDSGPNHLKVTGPFGYVRVVWADRVIGRKRLTEYHLELNQNGRRLTETETDRTRAIYKLACSYWNVVVRGVIV